MKLPFLCRHSFGMQIRRLRAINSTASFGAVRRPMQCPRFTPKKRSMRFCEIACWIEQVSNASLPKAVADEFLSPSGKDAWNQFKTGAELASMAIDEFDSARLRLKTKYKIALDLVPSIVVRKINDLVLHKAHLGEFLEITELRRPVEEAGSRVSQCCRRRTD